MSEIHITADDEVRIVLHGVEDARIRDVLQEVADEMYWRAVYDQTAGASVELPSKNRLPKATTDDDMVLWVLGALRERTQREAGRTMVARAKSTGQEA